MKAEKEGPLNLYYPGPYEINPPQLDERNATTFSLSAGGYTVIPGDVNDDANWIPIDKKGDN